MGNTHVSNVEIDKWLHDCILLIVVLAHKAENIVGFVPINRNTIGGHIWAKHGVKFDSDQGTTAFQFFFRNSAIQQQDWINKKVSQLINDCIVRVEFNENGERLVPTTLLDELAKLEDQ